MLSEALPAGIISELYWPFCLAITRDQMPLCLMVSIIQLDLSLIVPIVSPLSSSVHCGDTRVFFLLNFEELFSDNNDLIELGSCLCFILYLICHCPLVQIIEVKAEMYLAPTHYM